MALDSKGNLYIADTGNHRIRKISGGTITTIAGTGGTIGYSGDRAAATAATLNAPSGLAFDSTGNLYIADTGNNVIRKITGATITTVAGDARAGSRLWRRWWARPRRRLSTARRPWRWMPRATSTSRTRETT